MSTTPEKGTLCGVVSRRVVRMAHKHAVYATITNTVNMNHMHIRMRPEIERGASRYPVDKRFNADCVNSISNTVIVIKTDS